MTGGRVVVLGPTGRNFAAGMSGGIAYVLDVKGQFAPRCNKQMVGLKTVDQPEEIAQLRSLIQKHVQYTGSKLGKNILDLWEDMIPKFVKVLPKDYERVLLSIERVKKTGLSGEQAIMAAFEENVRDVSRVGGN